MKATKNIIQRNLPLNIKYSVISKSYIPLIEGGGTCCDNCGKIIANIAHVKDENNKQSYIGFDCLETFLINNQLLSGKDIEEYFRTKKMIPKAIRAGKYIKENMDLNPNLKLEKIVFEVCNYNADVFTFYKFWDKARPSNDYLKIKEMDLDFLIETLRAIFPRIEFEQLPWRELKDKYFPKR